MVAEAQNQGIEEIMLGAQIQAEDFYARLGFRGEGPLFLDGGIPHRTMRYRLGRFEEMEI
jgi:predicted GNAT family N-acyltransferase